MAGLAPFTVVGQLDRLGSARENLRPEEGR